ncbi:MAG: hypothetical protein ACTHU0_13390 [Kofleriaceae bacterium]
MKSRTLYTLCSLWLSASLAACGSKKEQAAGDPPAAPAGSTKAAPTAAPPAAKATADSLFGASIGLPAPATKLELGMTRDEATAAAPEVLGEKYGYRLPDVEGVKISVDISDKSSRVYAVRVETPLPVDDLVAKLTAKWGKPRSVDGSHYWNDGKLRVKAAAMASKSQLTFQSALAFDALLGTEKERFGFEQKPLIGMTREEIATTYARWTVIDGSSPDTVQFSLPHTEISEYTGTVVSKLAGGKVTGYTLSLSYDWEPSSKDKLAARLADRFGAPKTRDSYVEFAGPPKVTADLRDDQATVWVGKYK